MGDKQVKGSTRETTSSNTLLNAQSELIESIIRDTVNTAEIVMVNRAERQDTQSTAGRGTVTPLVSQTDGYDRAVPTTPLHALPFYRPQAGKAAILMEPQPGDKAIAIFTKRDSTGVDVGTKHSVPPGSHRTFDQADGFLINGFFGVAPEIWLLLDPESGNIELSTKAAKIDITCRESGDITIGTGSGTFTVEGTTDKNKIDAPRVTFTGDVIIDGNLLVKGHTHGEEGGPAVFSNGIINESGGIQNTGGLRNTGGIITSNGVTLERHTHTGDSGGTTSPPTNGT